MREPKSQQIALYTNNLKNREFDKKGPQNFCSERATIAEWLRTLTNSPVDCLSGKQVNEVNWPEGGASENKNSEAAESKKRSEGPFSREAGEQSELARRDPTQSKTDSSSCLCIVLRLSYFVLSELVALICRFLVPNNGLSCVLLNTKALCITTS
jgi:hypothetical protein